MGIVCIVEQSFLISLKTKQETGIVVLGANKKMLPEKRSSSMFKAQMHFYWGTHLHCYTSNKLQFLQFQCIEDNKLQLKKTLASSTADMKVGRGRNNKRGQGAWLFLWVYSYCWATRCLGSINQTKANNSNNHQSPKQTFPTQTIVARNDRIYSKRACRWL